MSVERETALELIGHDLRGDPVPLVFERGFAQVAQGRAVEGLALRDPVGGVVRHLRVVAGEALERGGDGVEDRDPFDVAVAQRADGRGHGRVPPARAATGGTRFYRDFGTT